jgi:hypothetical protein
MLQFGAKPPFSFERFIAMCQDLVPAEDLAYIRLCGKDELLEQDVSQPTLAQWLAFETGVRNELVKIRASRKKTDAQRFLRPGGSSDPQLFHIAINSHRVLSPVESEKFLDRARWQELEDLAFGHYFDRDALIVYALKLRINLRWEIIDAADKQEMLERILV